MTREKAIKIIKEFINGTCLHMVDQEALETLIPELKESEDERIRKELIEFIKWSVDRHFMREDFHQAKRPSEWLDYLDTQAKQKPAEWSEEDKLHYVNVLEALEYVKGCKSDYDKIEAVISDIAWFKSFRPQPQWKPTEEQMEALEEVIILLHNLRRNTDDRKNLEALREQLKKLRVEKEPKYYQHFDPDC